MMKKVLKLKKKDGGMVAWNGNFDEVVANGKKIIPAKHNF